MTRHEKTCKNQNACIVTAVHICPQCGKRCSTAHGLRRHCQSHNKVSLSKAKDQSRRNAYQCKKTAAVTTTPETNTPPHQFRCRRCTDVFDNRRDLYAHGIREHYNQHGGALQPRPWGRNDMAPWYRDDALRQVYEANAPLILENHRQGPLQSIYNFPLTNDVSMNQLMGYSDYVYRQQQRAFRLNLIFGVILHNRETGHYRYFVP